MKFPESSIVVAEIIKFLSQYDTTFALLGQNVAFDRKFFYSLFTRNGCHTDFISKINPTNYCTLEESKKAFLKSKTKPKSYKLGDLCEYFKIPLSNAHDALADIKATIKLYENIRSMNVAPLPFNQELTYEQKKLKYMDMKYISINHDGCIFISKEATTNSEVMDFILIEIQQRYGSK